MSRIYAVPRRASQIQLRAPYLLAQPGTGAGLQPAKAPCPLLHKYRSKVAEGNACPLTSTKGILWTGARTLRPRRDSSPKGGNRESRSGTLGQRSRLGTALSHKGSSSPPWNRRPQQQPPAIPQTAPQQQQQRDCPASSAGDQERRTKPGRSSALAHGASGGGRPEPPTSPNPQKKARRAAAPKQPALLPGKETRLESDSRNATQPSDRSGAGQAILAPNLLPPGQPEPYIHPAHRTRNHLRNAPLPPYTN